MGRGDDWVCERVEEGFAGGLSYHPPYSHFDSCSINALGPYLEGIVFTRTSLSKTFDWFYARIVQLLQFIPEEELQRGMYYPTQWDPFTFKDYMTLEDIFRISPRHFTFHLEQIAR